jgi:hypothetical protein
MTSPEISIELSGFQLINLPVIVDSSGGWLPKGRNTFRTLQSLITAWPGLKKLSANNEQPVERELIDSTTFA